MLFRASKTINDAIVYWTDRYKKILLTHSDFVALLTTEIAWVPPIYCIKSITNSMDESKYTASMLTYKQTLDGTLKTN